MSFTLREIGEAQDAKGLLDHLAHHPPNEELIPLRATVGFGGPNRTNTKPLQDCSLTEELSFLYGI